MDADYALALRIQDQLNDDKPSCYIPPDKNHNSNKPLSIIDPQWELTDPHPDIRSLLSQFDDTFFWRKLSAVTVSWSPRMYSCAGICDYEGRGGLCRIRLSQPLLQLRPRKDLIETLLHEMIHAYLFVTDNNKDHDGHGPEFHKHMYRINKDTGTNISVYHNFHDEVNEYRKHWWRCNGPCRERKPYYGFVKRVMNRPPSVRDFWWESHKQKCNGVFVKVKEPDGFGKRKKQSNNSSGTSKTQKTDASHISNIRSFGDADNVLKSPSQIANIPRHTSNNVKPSNNNSENNSETNLGQNRRGNIQTLFGNSQPTTSSKPSGVRYTGSKTSVITITGTKSQKTNDNKDVTPAPENPSDSMFPGTGTRLGGSTFNTFNTARQANIVSDVYKTNSRTFINDNFKDTSHPSRSKQVTIDTFFSTSGSSKIVSDVSEKTNKLDTVDTPTPPTLSSILQATNSCTHIDDDVVIIADTPPLTSNSFQFPNITPHSSSIISPSSDPSDNSLCNEHLIQTSRNFENNTEMHACPVCFKFVPSTEMNIHLDLCLFEHSDE